MCRGCVQRLEHSLGDVPALWHQLEVTLTRQDAMGTDEGRKSADSALPFKLAASEARWVLANTVGTWARAIAENAGISQPPAKPARWLLRNVQSIAMHPAADEAYDEITDAVRQAYRVIDRVADLLLAGRCAECEMALYARPTDETVTCRGCETQHLTAERRDAMIPEACGMLVDASTSLAWIHKFLGEVIPRGTWDSWVSRGRIVAHGTDSLGRSTYNFGEAWWLAEQWQEWQKKPKNRPAA